MNNRWCEIKLVKSLKKCTNEIYSLYLLKDGRLASCSLDKIQILSMKYNYSCDINFSSHIGYISYISQLDDGRLISCSADETIKIWEINKNKMECQKTLNGHDDAIRKVIPLTNNRIASCSIDKKILIWSTEQPFQLLAALLGHSEWVLTIMQLKNKEILVSGSDDFTLRWWDLNSYKCIYITENVYCTHSNCICELEYDRIIVGGRQEIAIISEITHQIISIIRDKDFNLVECFIPFDDSFIFGNEDGNIYCVKLPFFEYKIIKPQAHDGSIYCMTLLDDNFFASCSSDSTIKIWRIIRRNKNCRWFDI